MKNVDKKISLYIVFISIMCGGLLLIAAMFFYETYRGINSSMSSGVNLIIRQSVGSVEEAIRTTLTSAKFGLEMLEETGLGQADTFEDRLKLLPMLTKVLQENPTLGAVYVGYESGDFFYLYRQSKKTLRASSANLPPETAFLLTSITRDPEGRGEKKQWVLDSSMKHFYPYSDGLDIVDPRERLWFQQAQETDSIVSSRPYLFFGGNDLGLTMSKKIAGGQAVVAADIYTDSLKKALISLRATPHSEMAIIDETNELAAYTKDHIPRQEDVGPDGSIPVSKLDVMAFNELLDERTPDSKIIQYEDGKETWHGYVSTINEYYGNPLKILIAIPDSELIYKAEIDAKGQLITIGLMLFAFFIGAFIIAEMMFSPIKIITNHLSHLGHFNFSTPLKLKTSFKEIGQLRDTLNQISESLLAFQSIIMTLNQEKDSDKMFNTVLKLIVNIVQLKSGLIYIYSNQRLNLVAHEGLSSPLESAIHLSSDDLSDRAIYAALRQAHNNQGIYTLLRSSGGIFLGALCVALDSADLPDEAEALDELHKYLTNIAAAVAVGIETSQLIHSQKALLEAIIQLIANAIDAKSPYTGGHCKRVPVLAMMLMKEAASSKEPPFDSLSISPEKLEEFRIAAWLHDCGKVTTPEYVVDKATKLELLTNRIHEIRARFEILHRDATIRYLEAVNRGENQVEALKRRQAEEDRLKEDFAFIAKCNIGNEFMHEEDLERLKRLATVTWQRHFDNRLGLSREELARSQHEENTAFPVQENLLADKLFHLVSWISRPQVCKGDPANTLGFDMVPPDYMVNAGELYNLSIQRGTLTAEERFRINDHIIQSLIMLNTLPWPEHLKDVPEIACNHHEALNGKGYPRKLTADKLSIPARIMAIADVFEALTAPDRPYKDGKKLSESLAILAAMVKNGHLDKDIFSLFLQSEIYLKYAMEYMNGDQIDVVDIKDYL